MGLDAWPGEKERRHHNCVGKVLRLTLQGTSRLFQDERQASFNLLEEVGKTAGPGNGAQERHKGREKSKEPGKGGGLEGRWPLERGTDFFLVEGKFGELGGPGASDPGKCPISPRYHHRVLPEAGLEPKPPKKKGHRSRRISSLGTERSKTQSSFGNPKPRSTLKERKRKEGPPWVFPTLEEKVSHPWRLE